MKALTLNHNARVPRQHPGGHPYEDVKMAWSNSANCAVRMLAHHEAPKFDVAKAEDYILSCPKEIDPGKPLKPQFRTLLLEYLIPLFQFQDPGMREIACLALQYEELSAGMTLQFPPVGASCRTLAVWMNTFETDYEYVVKGHATWKGDIEPLLDSGQPVMIMLRQKEEYSYSVDILTYFEKHLGLTIGDIIPKALPLFSCIVLQGYVGSNDDNRMITYTGSSGFNYEMTYRSFEEEWSWKEPHEHLATLLEYGGVQKNTILYRKEKMMPGNLLVSNPD